MTKVTTILLALLVSMSSAFAGIKLDQAARIAAKDLLKKTINKEPYLTRVAFLPLKNDKYKLTDVFIATMTELNSDISFIARDQEAQDAAATETDFSEANDDIMDPKTITTLEDLKIKGIQAVFIGSIRTARETVDNAVFSATVRLIDTKTHKILSSAVLTTVYPQTEAQENFAFNPLVEKAARNAAYNLFKLLENTQAEVEKVALLPFSNDQQKLSEIIHNELSAAPGQVKFYTRSTKDWNRMENEREISSSMNTTISESTIANLKKVHGVKAILTGSIRQARVEGNEATVTLSLRLLNIETKQQIWSGNIEGTYTKPSPAAKITSLNRKATIKAAKALATELRKGFRVNKKTKAYSTPIKGEYSNLWKYIGPELKKSNVRNLKFYDFATSATKGYQAHLSRELSTQSFGLADLSRLDRQLDQLDSLLAEDGTYSDTNNTQNSAAQKDKRTLLTVDIYESQEDEDEDDAERRAHTVSLNATITDLENGEILWTTSVTETAKESQSKIDKAKSDSLVKRLTDYLTGEVSADRKPTVIELVIGGVILLAVGFFALIVLFFIFRLFTRSR